MKPHIFDDIRDAWHRTGLTPTQGFFIGAGLIATLLSTPTFLKYQAQIAKDKVAIAEVTAQRRSLELQLQTEKEQAAIANERYKSCLPVVGNERHGNTHYFSGIKPDTPINDRITNKPLVKGTVICDAHGQTAVIGDNGIPQKFAYTGNRDVIKSRLNRFRGSSYSQPIINN